MKPRSAARLGALLLFATLSPALLAAQMERGPYARIAILRPNDPRSVEFENGYIRHLAWHQQAGDTWSWYGWTVTYGNEHQRWFYYATFGRTAAQLDKPVDPAGDERDTVINVSPHVQYMGGGLFEFLPELSRGTGVPTPAARAEMVTVELNPGAEKEFEAALNVGRAALQDETLWYRMIAGGVTPRYVRLRPRPSYAALLNGMNEQPISGNLARFIAKTTVELLTFRPNLSYGIAPPDSR